MGSKVDFLVVGSGFTGATIARKLFDQGYSVKVIEARDHIAGNAYDYIHESGVRVHKYGPHYFRCNSERIWEFVNRFGNFYPYKARIGSLVDGQIQSWPINRILFNENEPIIKHNLDEFQAPNFEQACLAKMPQEIYEKFIKYYTWKQWGVPPDQLQPELARRIKINPIGEEYLSQHQFQGLPENGYHELIGTMLSGIEVELGIPFSLKQDRWNYEHLVFSGSLDQLLEYKFGKLSYRAQERETVYHPEVSFLQDSVQLNFPNKNHPNIRSIEWKHMLPQELQKKVRGTVVTTETPFSPENFQQYEYPFPSDENSAIYKKYLSESLKIKNLTVCGRLGDYRYYDMDQAIGRALKIADKILLKTGKTPSKYI